MVGGIFYVNYPGGSGLTSGAVFGRIAGQYAAKNWILTLISIKIVIHLIFKKK